MSLWDLASTLEAPWFISVVALVSLALTILPLVLGRRRDRLCYAVWGARILRRTEGTPGLHRRPRRKSLRAVENVTWLSIWNDGRAALRADDISTRDPLRVVVPGGSVLPGTRLEKPTDPSTGWDLHDEDGRLRVSFDILNPREGCVLRIPHTSRLPKSLTLNGTLANVGHPVRMADASSFAGKLATYAWLVYILFGFVIVTLGLLTYGTHSPITAEFLAAWILGDLGPAYAAYRYSDVRVVVPKTLREACVGLPELRDFVRVG